MSILMDSGKPFPDLIRLVSRLEVWKQDVEENAPKICKNCKSWGHVGVCPKLPQSHKQKT